MIDGDWVDISFAGANNGGTCATGLRMYKSHRGTLTYLGVRFGIDIVRTTRWKHHDRLKIKFDATGRRFLFSRATPGGKIGWCLQTAASKPDNEGSLTMMVRAKAFPNGLGDTLIEFVNGGCMAKWEVTSDGDVLASIESA